MVQVSAKTKYVPPETEVISWFEKYSNWGRWGPEDELGTMNFLTPSKRVQALQVVKEGVTISCQRPIAFFPSEDGYEPDKRFASADRRGTNRGYYKGRFSSGSASSFWVQTHGNARTHLDAPSHFHMEGKMYNGFPGELAQGISPSIRAVGTVKLEESKLGTDVLGDGVLGRGVLLDIPYLQQRDWLEAGEAIFPADLDEAEESQGVHVEEGNIVIVRTGRTIHRVGFGPGTAGNAGIMKWAGLHAACIRWLYERNVAMLASDTASDVSPSGYPNLVLPLHMVGLSAMGTWLLEGCNLEDLTMACRQRNRWDFLFTFAPWKAEGFTGFPVNPIAVF